MKTIPVCFLVVGMLLPAVCLAQPPEPPMGSPGKDKGGRNGPDRSFSEAWKIADVDRDGLISTAEFNAMPRIKKLPEEKRVHLFTRLDKDADGKLSRDELGRMGKPREGHGAPPLKRLWELDADKSGGVSLEEFKAGQLLMKLPAEKQQEVFSRLDTDGDGVITPKDRPESPFLRPDGKPRSNRPDGKHPGPEDGPGEMNRKLDVNGDGSLSFEEFRAGPAIKNLTEDEQEDRFEVLDRNGDLKISPEDFPPPPPAPQP
ncbi:EF-hand domain-containing protein [bacterium]|nr:EF-hand domain-containing protein [bacterium]